VRASGWTFAAGGPAPDGDAAVNVLNPGRKSTTVRLLAYASGGDDEPAPVRELTVTAGGQAHFNLGELGVEPDQVMVVRADAPVVAARRILGPAGASVALGIADP
jgi:hypothetical protein